MGFFDQNSAPAITDSKQTDKLERAMALRNGLVALCEGGANMNDSVYRLLRREFMDDTAVSHLVPAFVRTAAINSKCGHFEGHSGRSGNLGVSSSENSLLL